jgi:hypothetical protein
MRRLTAPLLALALSACDGETLVQCDVPASASLAARSPAGAPRALSQVPPVAVWVTVVDSATGVDLSAGASGTYVRGEIADSLRHDFTGLLTAYGPSGRYSLVVQHPGYAPWGSDEVRVPADQCGPEKQEVTARLRRAGQP